MARKNSSLVLLLAAVTCFASPEYKRSYFGSGWIDADHDCQNTREEVLIQESLVPVVYDKTGCKVISGHWYDPYGDNEYLNPKDLDIDHMVPLKEAWLSGAYNWSKEERIAYANDLSHPEHLIAVSGRLNRQKGAKSPEYWMPPNEKYWIEYVQYWAEIKKRNKLILRESEIKVEK